MLNDLNHKIKRGLKEILYTPNVTFSEIRQQKKDVKVNAFVEKPTLMP